LGAKGNEGVAGLVKQTPDSIGYVELVYAIQNRMAYGRVRNEAGEFVKADLPSVTAAATAPMPPDFRVSITNPPGKAAYPIASFTWLLIPAQIPDPAKRQALKDFLRWMLDEGQKMAPALSYAPLPEQVIQQERSAIEQIQ
jgi:phosphate transport system substrate-binding protein